MLHKMAQFLILFNPKTNQDGNMKKKNDANK